MWSRRLWPPPTSSGLRRGPRRGRSVKESKWGIIGLGWQLGALAGNWTDVEALEVSAARRIRARNTSTKVLVARNIGCWRPSCPSCVRSGTGTTLAEMRRGVPGAWTGMGVSIEEVDGLGCDLAAGS